MSIKPANMSTKAFTVSANLVSAILSSYMSLSLCSEFATAQDRKDTQTIETLKSLQPNMRAASDAYQDLVALIYNSQKFGDPRNTQRIKDDLKTLQSNFHSGDKKFSVLAQDPTASANLSALSEALKDAAQRFSEGSFDYARWRLKTINLNCVTCHASNESQLYSRQAEAQLEAPKHEQADFYLATRRFDKAKERYVEVIRYQDLPGDGGTDGIERLRALKGWLWVVIRHEVYLATSPDVRAAAAKKAANSFRDLTSKSVFSEETRRTINKWINDLEALEINPEINRWSKEGLTDIEEFSSFAAEPRNFVKVLALMQRLNERLTLLNSEGQADKGTHAGMKIEIESKKAEKNRKVITTDGDTDDANTQKAQIMLKLGILTGQSYDLTWDNLSDVYLKSCINQVPKSPVARLCFEAFKEFIEREFMGPGGSQLPEDIKSTLDSLKRSVE